MKDRYFVQCPFYKKEDALWVKCEGLGDRNRISLMFLTKKEKEEYMETHCEAMPGYKQCMLHQMLMSKYEGDK